MKFRSIVVAGVVVATTLAWSMLVQSCCMSHACENMRFLNAQIAAGYARCCQKPPEVQETCFDELDTKLDETFALILQAKIACDSSDTDLLRETIKKMRDLWLPKIAKSETTGAMNEMTAFGHADWVNLDVTLPRNPGSCKSVTVAVVDSKAVNAEATGKATESAGSGMAGTGTDVALVVTAESPQAYTSCEFTIPDQTTFSMRFGTELTGLGLAGSVSIAQTSESFPASGSAAVGLPTDMSLKANYLGNVLRLELDKTSPFNTLEVDANGDGRLGVALTLSSDSINLIGFVQVGSTIYFNFPVHVDAGFGSLRIHSTPATPGDTITPTDPIILLGADTTPHPGIANDRCADADGNGIRDGADEVIWAQSSLSGCETAVQH